MQMCPGQVRCSLLNGDGDGVGVGASGAIDIPGGSSLPVLPSPGTAFPISFLGRKAGQKDGEVGQKEAISNGMGTTNPCWEEFSPVEKGSQLGRGYKPWL